jgi:hypothetical protein
LHGERASAAPRCSLELNPLSVSEVVSARFLDPVIRSRRLEMIQQGQVFKLKTKGADGQPL